MKVLYARHAWYIEPNYELKFTRTELGRIYNTHVIVHYYNPAKLVINGQTHQIEKDCVFFLRKGDCVSVSYYDDSFIDYIHVMGNMGGFLGNFGLKFSTPYYPKTTSFCTSITKKLEEELYSLSPYTNDICCENVAYFISLLARYLNPEYEKSFDNKSLKELRTEMKNHPEYNWTGEKMAQFVGMGETAFYESYFKMFKKSDAMRQKSFLRKASIRSARCQKCSVIQHPIILYASLNLLRDKPRNSICSENKKFIFITHFYLLNVKKTV